ncbi:MAG: hypothetical protein JW864_06690, partial [Spirochaetes bacterium]|nr:hypothetical protein [Spirochaetota bacterium]
MFDTKDIFYRLLLIRNVCLWEYDGFGRVVESSDPDMGYSRFVYNAFGEVESVTDSLDRTTEMTYDRLGRLYDKTLPGSEGVVEYRYDEYTGSTNALGRVVRIDDPAQTKVFSYDRMGRIDRETRFIKPEGTSVSSGSFETEFEYDLLNRKRTILYPTDPKTGTRISARYKYASTGVTEVSVYNSTGRKEIISGVLYNEFGQMTEVARGNGTSTHYEYDIKGRLANLVTFTQTNDQTRKLQDVSYTFKIDGSIASTVNTPDLDTDGGYHSMVRYDYA